jgi:hypothetical protein
MTSLGLPDGTRCESLLCLTLPSLPDGTHFEKSDSFKEWLLARRSELRVWGMGVANFSYNLPARVTVFLGDWLFN